MGIDGIGSSVVIALAAVLWFVYLVPTWLKRREYLATERNAVRLQQTMRIMAESAELPAVVRVEATARTVAAQERALRRQEAARSASGSRRSSARHIEAKAISGLRVPPAPSVVPTLGRSARIETPLAARRLRRSRALASLVLLAALVAGGFGAFVLVTTGSWMLLAASVVVAAGSLALLGQAASVSRARAELRRAATPVAAGSVLHDHADYSEEPRPGWTPVPLPKPLYLSAPAPAVADARSSTLDGRRLSARHMEAKAISGLRVPPAPSVVPTLGQGARIETAAAESVDHAAVLRAAAAEAERALREAQAAPEVARIEAPAARVATSGGANARTAAARPFDAETRPPSNPEHTAASRFARMGRVDQTDAAPADLDDILRRRRAAG